MTITKTDKLTYQDAGDGHLKVSRIDGADGITWDELQRIKNEVWGEEQTAIEVFPPQGELVNDANIRHLWLVPSAPSLLR